MSDRFQLAIESTATRASVALGRAGELVFAEEVEAGGRQSEVLMNPLRAALHQLVGEEVGTVVVGTGPGSYNGARVGIAAGQGVALVHGCPAVGVCSLESLEVVRSGMSCLAIGDARRDTFFTIVLRDGRLSGAPALLAPEEFLQSVREAVEDGMSLITFEEVDRLNLPEDLAAGVERGAPSAEGLLAAWNSKSEEEQGRFLASPPQPFYLREAHITKPGQRGKAGGVVES